VDDLEIGSVPLRVAKSPSRRPLGAVLIASGTITTEELESALVVANSSGCRLGEALVALGTITPRVLASALAEQAGLEFLDLGTVELDAAAVALLPEQFARRNEALPIRFLDEDTVQVAVADPTNILVSDDLRLALGLNIRLAVVEAEVLELTLERAYKRHMDLDLIDDEAVELELPSIDDIAGDGAGTAPAIKFVNSIIGLAVDEGASDVHFEPEHRELNVRARVDGVMRTLTTVSKSMHSAVISRIKVMAGLDIAERRAPQDGRITVRYEGHGVDIRVAVLPTAHGEKAVLRMLHRQKGGLDLSLLGMNTKDYATFTRAMRQPYGVVIACGPTGSGKTTTLYAAVSALNDSERVITTIEDPVEYQVPGITQVEVNVKAGLTFARGLRTMLRSDPDVLLVGEIRDDETASIAIQAAMTGHLVFTTLHTHDAASSIERLKQMGLDASALESALTLIVAQRLARRLCLDCREPYLPGDLEEFALLGVAEPTADLVIYRPTGCVRCAGTGYIGRAPVYELLPIRGRIRRLLSSSSEELFQAAVEDGMTTLRQDGARLVLEGVSSIEEIRRITGDGWR